MVAMVELASEIVVCGLVGGLELIGDASTR
jgi:hypothetical protein